jgi:predicted ester cyclase
VISTIEDLIAEGDKVVARWRSRATPRETIWASL